MRDTLFVAYAVLIGVAVFGDAAMGQQAGRYPLGENPNPVVPGMKGRPTPKPKPPAPPPAKQPPPPPVKHKDNHKDRDSHHDSHRSGCVSSYSWFQDYYSYPGTYTYQPYCVYTYPYPAFYYAPEGMFGPMGTMRFMGIDGSHSGELSDNAPRNNNADLWNDPDDTEPKNSVERASNARANALAWRFIGYGDARFAEQKYLDANVRYRKASQAAPQVADVWFRQGFTLSALGRYDQAVTSIKRGLKFNPRWPKSDFRLTTLFGPDEALIEAHIEELTHTVRDKPNDASLQFLVGVHLHFNGQSDAAAKYFSRAQSLLGGDDEHVRPFLAK